MKTNEIVENESIRLAMNQAWTDHQHTRDQTWKALYIEFFIVLGVVGANWQFNSNLISIVSVVFVCIIVLFGIQITLRHRNSVEVRKFQHIINCEEALGLHSGNLITDVEKPVSISFWDAFHLKKGNTALFILRMHVSILGFALFILIFRLITL